MKYSEMDNDSEVITSALYILPKGGLKDCFVYSVYAFVVFSFMYILLQFKEMYLLHKCIDDKILLLILRSYD